MSHSVVYLVTGVTPQSRIASNLYTRAHFAEAIRFRTYGSSLQLFRSLPGFLSVLLRHIVELLDRYVLGSA